MGIFESKKEYKAQNIQNTNKVENIQNMKKNQGGDSENILGKNFVESLGVITKASEAICKITIRGNPNTYETGFFMKISDTKKYLITNYHVINQHNIYDDIEIEIHN